MSSAQSSGKASGGQLEERVDLSAETTEKIAQATSLVETAKNNPASLPSALQDALALLSALEKKCRVGNDTPSLVNVCRTMLTLCREGDTSADKEVLHATLKQLSTRRSQKSKAIAVLVETVSPWLIAEDGYTPLDTTEFSAARHDLLTTLRNISSGKMYLEAEYARITRSLAILAEADWRGGEEGKLSEAADLLGEVHVETYGSLSKREKVEFVLEQMRLNLMRKVSDEEFCCMYGCMFQLGE
jgi:26S proteasome regulatory subunit N5